MSIFFPKLPKPRQWDYRPIYYDEEKERRKERLRQLQEEREAAEGKPNEQATEGRQHNLHRGSFREAAERNQSTRVKQNRQANIRFFVILLMLLLLLWWLLS